MIRSRSADPLEQPPHLLRRLLFQEPTGDRTWSGIVLWWEGRRLLFNLVVGGAGLVTISVLGAAKAIAPAAPFLVDWQLVVLFALMANVLYTTGWLAELWLRRFLNADHPVVGPVLFRYGVIGSVCLALLPVVLAVLVTLNRLLGRPIAGW